MRRRYRITLGRKEGNKEWGDIRKTEEGDIRRRQGIIIVGASPPQSPSGGSALRSEEDKEERQRRGDTKER